MAEEKELIPLKSSIKEQKPDPVIEPKPIQTENIQLTHSFKEEENTFQEITRVHRMFSGALYGSMILFNIITIAWILIYLTQYNNNVFADTYAGIETANIIVYTFLMLGGIGIGVFSLYTLFIYGGTNGLLKSLEALSALIAAQSEQLQLQAQSLTTAVQTLENETKITALRQSNLNDIVVIGEELGRLGQTIQVNDESIAHLLNGITQMQNLANVAQRQIYKNEMIRLFYELEQTDGKDGLSKTEYDRFLSALDKQTSDAWHTAGFGWKRLKGRDGVIDVNEFQSALDHVFDVLDAEDVKTIERINPVRSAEF